MLALGHMGITLAVGLLAEWAVHDSFLVRRKAVAYVAKDLPETPPNWYVRVPRAHVRSGLFDLRFWLVGSLLPDIIDKPLGHYLLHEFFGNNGRIFSHSLLFAALLLIVGLYLYSVHDRGWLLALGLGTVMHLVLDSMWQIPHTLFWPFLGSSFPTQPPSDWLSRILGSYHEVPSAYIPEIIGGVIIIGFGVWLVARHRTKLFLRTGEY